MDVVLPAKEHTDTTELKIRAGVATEEERPEEAALYRLCWRFQQ
jgi:hypothetical protein